MQLRHGAPRLEKSGDSRRSPRASGLPRRRQRRAGFPTRLPWKCKNARPRRCSSAAADAAALGLRRESPLSGPHRTPPNPTPPPPPTDSASPIESPRGLTRSTSFRRHGAPRLEKERRFSPQSKGLRLASAAPTEGGFSNPPPLEMQKLQTTALLLSGGQSAFARHADPRVAPERLRAARRSAP